MGGGGWWNFVSAPSFSPALAVSPEFFRIFAPIHFICFNPLHRRAKQKPRISCTHYG